MARRAIRVGETERFLEAVRDSHAELHPTLFHVVLWSLARMSDRHPRLVVLVRAPVAPLVNGVTSTAASPSARNGSAAEVGMARTGRAGRGRRSRWSIGTGPDGYRDP